MFSVFLFNRSVFRGTDIFYSGSPDPADPEPQIEHQAVWKRQSAAVSGAELTLKFCFEGFLLHDRSFILFMGCQRERTRQGEVTGADSRSEVLPAFFRRRHIPPLSGWMRLPAPAHGAARKLPRYRQAGDPVL